MLNNIEKIITDHTNIIEPPEEEEYGDDELEWIKADRIYDEMREMEWNND